MSRKHLRTSFSRQHAVDQIVPRVTNVPNVDTTPATSTTMSTLSHACQTGVVFLFHLLVLTVPFFFTWVNEELFEFNKMMLTYAITTLILGTWAIRVVAEKKINWKHTVFDLPLGLFVLSQILATLFSIHPYTSLFGYYTRFHGGLLSTLTYVSLFYAFIHNVEAKHLKSLFLTLFIAALGISAYAIPEHFGVSPSCVLINSDQTISSQDVGTSGISAWWSELWSQPQSYFTVSCWVQDVKTRVFATFGQPNWLAAYVITLLPMGLALTLSQLLDLSAHSPQVPHRLHQQPSWLKASFYGITSLSLFMVLLFTQSRSGLLGLVAGLGVFGLGILTLLVSTKSTSLPQALRQRLLITSGSLAAACIIIGAGFGTAYTPSLTQVWHRVTTTTPLTQPEPANEAGINRLEVGGTNSGRIRRIVWKGAWDVWKRYPVFGSGVETFAYSYYQDRPAEHNLVSEWDFLYNKAHNEFLNFLATTGVVGLAAYLGLLASISWVCLTKLWTTSRQPAQLTTYLLTLSWLSGLIALSISNFFGFSTVMVSILLFLIPAWLVVSDEPVSRVQLIPTPGLSLTQIGLMSLTAIVTLYALGVTYTTWHADWLFTQGKNWLQAGNIQQGDALIRAAIAESPQEALYYDELATTYAQVAVSLAEAQNATKSSQLAQEAVNLNNQALTLNPAHLNFHKTRLRIFMLFSQINPELLPEAKKTAEVALSLSPTDAKLVYNLGRIEAWMGATDQALATYEKAIALKSDYQLARMEAAKVYRALGEQNQQPDLIEKAKNHYQYILTYTDPENQELRQALAELEAGIPLATPTAQPVTPASLPATPTN